MSIDSVLRAKSALLPLVIKERREQLGLSHKEVAERAKRRALRPGSLAKLEDGEGWLPPNEVAHLEDALELPAGFLDDGLFDNLEDAADPASVTAADVLERLQKGSAAEKQEFPTVNGCAKCFRSLRGLVSRYGLDLHVGRNSNDICICEGKLSWRGSDTAILLRLAIWVTAAKRVIILGGGQDVQDIAGSIGFADVRVVRGRATAATAKDVCRGADIVVLARGEIGHAASKVYLNARATAPEAEQPKLIYSRSSNITAIAEELLWSLDS